MAAPARALRLYGPAVAPVLPLVLLISLLAGIWVISPSEAPAAPGGRRWVVADTDGAGVFLRNSPNPSDRKAVVAEGTFVVEVGASADPAWRYVSVGTGGPVGWVQAQYVRLAP